MTRIDHSGHRHPATPAARATCRKIELLRREAGDAFKLDPDHGSVIAYATVERVGRLSRLWIYVSSDWSFMQVVLYQGYDGPEPRRISMHQAQAWASVIGENL